MITHHYRRCHHLSGVTRGLTHLTYGSAIVRSVDELLPLKALRSSSHSNTTIDYNVAVNQHKIYCNALKMVGLVIHELPSDGFPDSVFIEDTVVAIGNEVLITRSSTSSRRGEGEAIDRFIASTYKSKVIHRIDDEVATIDGGDVLFTGRDIIVGKTRRTNDEGISCLTQVFSNYNVIVVDMCSVDSRSLHLKSICSMCGDNRMLIGGQNATRLVQLLNARSAPARFHCEFIIVEDEGAANCVYANGTLIRRAAVEFPRSAAILESLGGSQLEIEYGELTKVDGALTCCSVLMT